MRVTTQMLPIKNPATGATITEVPQDNAHSVAARSAKRNNMPPHRGALQVELLLLVLPRRLRDVPFGTDSMLCFHVIASSCC